MMKKLALILASLTFFAGCADSETPDVTETETEYNTEYGTGTPAAGETGTETDADINVTPVVPVVPVEPATSSPGAQQGSQQGTMPQAQESFPGTQPGDADNDIQIITTNELNAPQGQQQNNQP